MKIPNLLCLSLVVGLHSVHAQSWVNISAKVPSGPKGVGSYSMASTGPTLYLSTFNGIQRSVDNGNTWTTANQIAGKDYTHADFGVRCLVATGSTVWVGGEPGSMALTMGTPPLHRLASGASSWTPSFSGATAPPVIDAIALDAGTNTLWAAGRLGSIYKSTNGGTSWTDAKGNLPGTNIASIVARNGKVIVTVQGVGVFTSTDGGTTWQDRGAPLVSIGNLSHVGDEVVVVGSGSTTLTSGAYVSKDFGLTWTLKQDYMTGTRILEKTCSDSTTIFAGGMVTTFTPTYQVIFTPTVAMTKDGGDTWETLAATGLPEGHGISSLQRHGNYLFATLSDPMGAQSIYRLEVGGSSTEKSPEITVEQPLGKNLVDAKATIGFGTVRLKKTGKAKTFTIRNTGTAQLQNLAVALSGKQAKDFVLTPPKTKALAPGGSTTFKLSFRPKAKGPRRAAIKIRSNDADENPFDIKLTGSGK